ncbi:MAG: hypothetical protein ABJA67_04160 [Chthonomonadales bacterium]
MNRIQKTMVLTGVICVTAGVVAGAQLGSIIKGGAVALAVDKFGPDINKGINSLYGEHNTRLLDETKVVPIISLGDSGYIGAVQVSGPASAVHKVKAVVQLEGRFNVPVVKGIRLRGLVPVASKSASRSIERVPGVGVSAIVDIKL